MRIDRAPLPREMYLLLLIAAVLLAGCGDAGKGSAESTDGRRVHSVSENGDTAFLVKRGDPEMERAQERARCTLSEFRRRFRDPPATQTALGLKATFREDGAAEHLWLHVVSAAADSAITGTVANDPGILRGLAFGDTVTVWPAEVADWYAIDRDTLVGGFTMRVWRARMTPAERAADDRAKPYAVDPDSAAWRRLEPFCVPARL